MSSKLFKNFIKKAVLSKQGPPGAPPRQGLQWKPSTHRWIRPQGFISSPSQSYHARLMWTAGHFLDQATSIAEEIKENSIGGSGSTKRIMARLKGLEQGEEYGLARLQDEISDVLRDSRINQYNSPTLIDLSQAINSISREEKDSGLSESNIVSGYTDDPETTDEDQIEDFDIADLPEIAFENIKTDVEMAGLPGPKHFKNAKEYAEYLSESTFQSLVDIRNDDDPDPAYFRDNVGFPDTDENIDAYADALDAQAKEYSEIPDFAKEYGTGTHIDDMEEEDYDEDYDEEG